MLAATPLRGSIRPSLVRSGPWPGVIVLALLALWSLPAQADDTTVEGLFVTVQNPITSEVVNRAKDMTLRAVQRFKSGAPSAPSPSVRVLKIVYDFNPDDRSASTSDFGPCSDLASFLLEQQEVHTIAFVHNKTTGHTVLPVLACRDIVMSAEAKLGDVCHDPDSSRLLASMVPAAYREVIRDRRCPAIVLKMLDRDMEVVRAKRLKGSGDWYIDLRLKEAEAKNGVIVLNPTPVLGKGGHTTLYDQKQAEQFGLSVLRKETRQEVAEAYGLPPTSLREDPLMGRTPNAWRIEVRGAVSDALAESLKRQIGRAVHQKANLIILQLDCGGGDPIVANDLARYLRDRKDDQGNLPVMTVAYIARNAPDTAVFLALGCTEIVMHREASLGDFGALITERRNGAVLDVDPGRYRATREALESLAQAQGYPVSLARGMMDREVALYEVRDRKTGQRAFLSGEELQADRADPHPRWGQEQLLKAGGPKGRALILKADDALRWGVARHRVESLNEVYAVYGLNSAQVQMPGFDWLDELAEFLRRPLTRIFLVMLGIICLILELKMPGVGVPGVIAAVCFLLFFWSHSQAAGLDLLAVLLFVLGLVLIALEIFVLPGLAVAGVSGALLIVFSLALVAAERRPQTTEEWGSLLALMGQFGIGLLVSVAAAIALASYLPSIPFLNRLVLKPKADSSDSAGEGAAEPLYPDLAGLLGAIGVAATPLHPAGKVKFGDEYIDVVAEGSFRGDRREPHRCEGSTVGSSQ
jgi:membrane-bound ClpP family serine protease